MKHFSVANWDDYQHYKDRNPPWIKLHNQLLDKYEFTCLQDASKAHLLAIWMLASRTNNKLPLDSRWIGNKISATEEVDLQALMGAGFLVEYQEDTECKQDASTVQAKRSPEERRGEESKTRKTRLPDAPSLSDQGKEYALKHWAEKGYAHLDPSDEFESFCNHHKAKGSTMASWEAAWQTWVRNAVKFGKPALQVVGSESRPIAELDL